jgi:lysophospholipase L1-like esterase
VPGARYVVSAWVKGQGQASLGVYEYAVQDHTIKFRQRVATPNPLDLSADWRKLSLVYRPADDSVTVAFYAMVSGEGGKMSIDDVTIVPCPEPPMEVSLGRVPAMTPAGTVLRLPLAVQGSVASPQLSVVLRGEDGAELARQALPQSNPSEPVALPLPGQPVGYAWLSVVERTSGAMAAAQIDVCPKDVCDACQSAVEGVKLKGPCHLVFVGDSLTAFFAGHNYVDKVRWWLQSRLGESVHVSNAGVGGDTITRVKDRLEKDVLSLQPPPTHVFIFLGHNDSKLKSSSEYHEAVVTPADFDRDYREVVRTIQERLKAKVTIVSSTSSVYEITEATAAEASKRGKSHNLFGKPETLEQFNAIARKVATDLGADYLDVYEPFRTHPQKPSLFTRDGVHINEQGNRLMTLELLKYLSR